MSVAPMFHDRHAAGLALGEALRIFGGRRDVLVLGLARGGVAVAAPLAHTLDLPCDALICRKLGVPGIDEVAFGAIAEGVSKPVLDSVHHYLGIPRAVSAPIVRRERREIVRRVQLYRNGCALPQVNERIVIVVDDGLASGATLLAAAKALRPRAPARLIAAVPVASAQGMSDVAPLYDEVVSLATPDTFGTVSDWYEDFTEVDDSAVRTLLGRSAKGALPDAQRSPAEREVSIPSGDMLGSSITADFGHGDLTTPHGLVIFAHGGGSSRASYRNRYLGARLRLAGWSTLRVDLLTTSETVADAAGELRFDIPHITGRLRAATRWCIDQRLPGSDHVVLFGASTGAAAAIGVAAQLGEQVAAVVARGGRIDLSADKLALVAAPTLLVVGGVDEITLQLNRACVPSLRRCTLQVIPGAGHTFEEAGALGTVGEAVVEWLARRRLRHLVTRWSGARRVLARWRSLGIFANSQSPSANESS